jgi:hypothetical protein
MKTLDPKQEGCSICAGVEEENVPDNQNVKFPTSKYAIKP